MTTTTAQPTAHATRTTDTPLPAAPSAADAIEEKTTSAPPADRQASDPRAIVYDQETYQYRASYDGIYIDSFWTIHDADVALGDYERGLFEDGLIDAPPAIFARPADPAEFVCGQPTGNPHNWCGCDYILGEEPPPPLDPNPATLADAPLHAEPSAGRVGAATPQPLLSVCRRCGAPSPTWLCDACEPPRDPDADLRTMEMLMRATLEAWKCLEVRTSFDDELAALARQVERLSAPTPTCRECGGPHTTATCPAVKAERLHQERLEHAGRGVWTSYTRERSRFLRSLARIASSDCAAMADALAWYLTCANETHVVVTADRVLGCWSREIGQLA